VTPVKTAHNSKTKFFNAHLQTTEEKYEAVVCFDTNTHWQFTFFQNNKSPVKLCTITKSASRRVADQLDIAVNPSSKVMKIDDMSIGFQYKPQPIQFDQMSDISQIPNMTVNDFVTECKSSLCSIT
jgi:hypothetical protein